MGQSLYQVRKNKNKFNNKYAKLSPTLTDMPLSLDMLLTNIELSIMDTPRPMNFKFKSNPKTWRKIR